MDPKQFDELVARLASSPSRRDALKGAVGGALAAVGVTSAADAKKQGRGGAGGENKKGRGGGGRAGAEACIPTGKKCPSKKPRGKKKKKLSCDKCCQRHTIVANNGRTKCSCRPDGFATDKASHCCSGFATGGQCAPYGDL